LNKYFELNYKNFQFDSSFYLFNACKSGNKAAVIFLLEHGANINKSSYYQKTPLFMACQKGTHYYSKIFSSA